MTSNAATARATIRILLIEDNPADTQLMRYALDQENFRYKLIALKDGEEALAFIRREGAHTHATLPPRLIVMDLHLPKHDGLEILQEIRSSAGFAHLPVVILSSSVQPEEKEKVAEYSRTCFIAKPRDLDQCLTVGKRIRQLAMEGLEEPARAGM